jgi:predicted secreted protein
VTADEQPLTYDRVSLAASAEREVSNDVLTALLYIQREGSDAASLAEEVNRAIEWGVAEAKKLPAVKVQTRDYRTHPIYSKQTLSGWRVRQSMRLESVDAAGLGALLGRLQQRLALESLGYELSPERRTSVENELIGEAIAAFSARARLIAEQFGRRDYRLVSVDIGSGGTPPRPYLRSAALPMRAESAAPTIEAGSQTVEVQVRGTIELQVQ